VQGLAGFSAAARIGLPHDALALPALPPIMPDVFICQKG
jgi:hypothetical protein